MIARILALLALCGLLCDGVFGVPYSRVYVRSSAETSPVEYVNYGAPAYPLSAPLTAPVIPPCLSPCVLPSGTVAAVAPLTNANIVAYNPPIANAPVVIAPSSDDKSSYEYSYVVYDENTGDHKEQRELSDGSTVQGQYSLIQPDGYVREVKYTADDVKGFNAVIRNYLPSNPAEEKKEEGKSNELPPCRESKSEALVDEPKEEKNESSESSESKDSSEKKSSNEGSKESMEKTSEKEGKMEKSSSKENTKEEITEKNEKNEGESSETESKESNQKGSGEEGSKEKVPNEESSKEEGSEKEDSKEEISKEEGSKEERKKGGASKEENEGQNSEEKESSASEVKPGSSEESKNEATRSEESSAPDYTVDIIKCIQAAMKSKIKLGTNSPLTYIVLPSTPC